MQLLPMPEEPLVPRCLPNHSQAPRIAPVNAHACQLAKVGLGVQVRVPVPVAAARLNVARILRP